MYISAVLAEEDVHLPERAGDVGVVGDEVALGVLFFPYFLGGRIPFGDPPLNLERYRED
jgi:hypothetical protein